jgi:hypothetical protein
LATGKSGMKFDVKQCALIFLFLALLITVAIAAALPQLELKPGIPLPVQPGSSSASSTESFPLLLISFSTLLKAMLGVILLSVLAYSFFQVLRGFSWKEIWGPSIFIALAGAVAVYVIFALSKINVTIQPEAVEVLPPAVNITGPQLEPLPQGLIWFVLIGLAILMILLGLRYIIWHVNQDNDRDPLSLEAERAIQGLRTGLDLKNVILHCYLEMSQVLQKEQGLALEESMTAREFERLLQARGIPNSPVHQLTQLFEFARYGYRQPDAEDEQKAIDCFNAIAHFSRKVKSNRSNEKK